VTAPGRERLFTAIALPDPVRAVLAALARPLPGVAWTAADQLHLTLRFLGDVPTTQLDTLTARLAGIRIEPFVLPIEGLGAFPPKSPPRVLWAGIGTGHPRLHQLRQRLDDALLAEGVDFDVHTFQPHVTLARCTEHATAAAGHWLHTHRDFVAPPFRVESFGLYASELRPEGAVHTLQREFPLTT